MKALKLALKKQPIVYIARDLERALGLPKSYSDYYIITNKSPLSQKSKVKSQKNILCITSKKFLDTHELLNHPKTSVFLKKLINPKILVFKNTSAIEQICKEKGLELLNPPSILSSKIEEKISQIEWLGELTKFLPPYRIDICKNIQFEGTKFILQFNRAHTGNGTILIESPDQLKELHQKFPDRPVRVTEFINGPMFTNNNVVWNTKVLCGSINYQITGLMPFTDRPFATIGNDWSLPQKLLTKKLQQDYFNIAQAVGKRLAQDGWKGLFGIDVVLDQKKKRLYLIEINARQPASTTYESQLQEDQKSLPKADQPRAEKIKSQKSITTFEAHLASLLELEYDGQELIQIKDGAQIIQRVTNNFKNQKSKIKNFVKDLEKLNYNVITYNNTAVGDDLIRIQSKKGILNDHNVFNKNGEEISNAVLIKPPIIKKLDPGFEWESKKIWKLRLPIVKMDLKKLIWHMKIPFWEKEGTDDWNLTPQVTLDNPEREPTHYQKILQADTSYPIAIIKIKGKWRILDGLHRLAKLVMNHEKYASIIIIPKNKISYIKKTS